MIYKDGENSGIMYRDERTSGCCQRDYGSIIISNKNISINLSGETFSNINHTNVFSGQSTNTKKKKKPLMKQNDNLQNGRKYLQMM